MLRAVLRILVLYLVIVSLCTSGDALGDIEYTQLNADQMFAVLDNLGWVPDGAPNARHIYVISAPWCPYCKDLYKKTRRLNSTVQFRWIMVGAQNANDSRTNQLLSFTRDPQLLNTALTSGTLNVSPPLNSDFSQSWNVISLRAIKKCIDLKANRQTGYPALIYFAHGDWRIGGSGDIGKIVSEVAPRPEAKNIRPLCAQVITNNVITIPMTHTKFVANKSEVFIYSGPSTQALRIFSYSNKETVPFNMIKRMVQLEDGSKWFTVEDGQFIWWGQASDFN